MIEKGLGIWHCSLILCPRHFLLSLMYYFSYILLPIAEIKSQRDLNSGQVSWSKVIEKYAVRAAVGLQFTK